MSLTELQNAYDRLHLEAVRLAGNLPDLAQRAAVYYHLYQHSGGNHVFPLIAAHGALWARGYFTRCLRLGGLLAWQYGFDRTHREQKIAQLNEFADEFREVNRRVCVDTYVNYHFSAQYCMDPDASRFVPQRALDGLNALHAARRNQRDLTEAEKRNLFEAHFLDEQDRIVGPTIEHAVERFNWPVVKFLGLKPIVRFAFFPVGRWFWFQNFARRDERIRRGMTAFDIASQVGWKHVEVKLRAYHSLPEPFFSNPAEFFAKLRRTILSEA